MKRHWKQHWDPDAPLVFIRKMNLGIEGAKMVNPGDDVTPAIRAALGPCPARATARLRRWWNAKFLAIKGWQAPDEIQRARHERGLPRLELQDMGKGWFLVYGAEPGQYTKVRGRKNADEKLTALKAADAKCIAEYQRLVADGLSDYEARETVWPASVAPATT